MSRHPQLTIGLSLAPTWLVNEGWRAEDSGIERLYSVEFALEIARAAEAAKLDFVFRPDASFLPVPVMEQSFGFASLDPTLLIAALASQTRQIGLMTTISTTFVDPYTIARQLMSLQWMTKGRAGWNVVTGLDGHFNFSMAERPSSQDRHARAIEAVNVARALWQSFPPEALLIDRSSGRFADTALLAPINHAGTAFQVQGPLNIPQFDGPRMPIMQAGSSPSGIDLAGRVADMVFAQTPDIKSALALQHALGARATAHGRRPEDVRLLPGLSLYLAHTKAEALALFHANHIRVAPEQKIMRIRNAMGLDLSDRRMEERVTRHDLEGLSLPQSDYAQNIAAIIIKEEPRLGDLLTRREVLASVHWQIIGTVEEAACEIEDWFKRGAVDGFIATPGGDRSSLDLCLGQLIPLLGKSGIFRSEYTGASFAQNLGLRC